ncbi:hypothetical protein H1R20_g5190, partial [Candolleomyces eurysporus]
MADHNAPSGSGIPPHNKDGRAEENFGNEGDKPEYSSGIEKEFIDSFVQYATNIAITEAMETIFDWDNVLSDSGTLDWVHATTLTPSNSPLFRSVHSVHNEPIHLRTPNPPILEEIELGDMLPKVPRRQALNAPGIPMPNPMLYPPVYAQGPEPSFDNWDWNMAAVAPLQSDLKDKAVAKTLSPLDVTRAQDSRLSGSPPMPTPVSPSLNPKPRLHLVGNQFMTLRIDIKLALDKLLEISIELRHPIMPA